MTISVSAAQSVPIDITIQTVSGTATGGVDFTEKGGRRTIPAGDAQKIIFIPIADDTDTEGDEDFQLVISNPVNASIADGQATITIVDNDTGAVLPTLDIADASTGEGFRAEFLLTLSQASAQPISYTIATIDETATGGVDLHAKSRSTYYPGGCDVGQTICADYRRCRCGTGRDVLVTTECFE